MTNDSDVFSKLIYELEKQNSNILGHFLYNRVPMVLFNRAVKKSADYVEKNMPGVIVFTASSKPDMWNCAISKIKIDGLLAEFGVFEGGSINYLSQLVYPKTIFGFDSFFGLEEDYSLDHPKGSFNKNGKLPEVNSNVCLIPGSFSKTLKVWLDENPGVFSFINIDCDTYDSTSTVLNLLGPDRLVPGTMILFDEYFGFHGWEDHEFKAWQEYCSKNSVKYRYVAVCHMQVLVEVL
jgi:hypothetical protein